MRKLPLFLIPLLLANLFCVVGTRSQAPTPTPDLSLTVNATLTALAVQPVPTQAAGTPLPAGTGSGQDIILPTGTVSGEYLMFPADILPALRIVFFNTDYMPVSYTDTAPGQSSYSLELPIGSYHVVAYALRGDGFIKAGTAGGYTEAVTCGLTTSCNDHHLLLITLHTGEHLSGINPNDYYAPENSFPPMPK